MNDIIRYLRTASSFAWVPIDIPFPFVAEYLENPERWSKKYRYFSVEIRLDRNGRRWEYGEWALPAVGNYPDEIKGAITRYFETRKEEILIKINDETNL